HICSTFPDSGGFRLPAAVFFLIAKVIIPILPVFTNLQKKRNDKKLIISPYLLKNSVTQNIMLTKLPPFFKIM
ncbi:MAG: hypothetical protein K2M20_04960, partial [Lachnospiraceae bacterium]|nr:hypothetical protein [Lachnospiraceae bacterium]